MEGGLIMSDTVKAALIAGILGLIGTIAAAIIGLNLGKSTEQKNIQNEFNDVMGDIVNIFGNDNKITINNIKELIKDYQDLQTMNDFLLAQNAKYFDDLTETNNKIKELQTITSKQPNINYSNLALSIEGEDIAVNKNNSMVTIDGRDYFSREIVEKLIPENRNLTIKDSTIFIGQVVADKANLFDINVLDSKDFFMTDSVKDSYNNYYSHVLRTNTYGSTSSYIIYTLERKYSLLKISVAIERNAYLESHGILTIKADDKVIYTSKSLDKKMEVLIEQDIPIENCNLLTIEYRGNSDRIDCIIFDAIVYN